MNVDDLFKKIGRLCVEGDLLRDELLNKQQRITELEAQVAALADAAVSKTIDSPNEDEVVEEG